jgi:antitoxin component of MazEF toxin-antitoxin module
MSPAQLLKNLGDQGFNIELQNNSLLVSPKWRITESIRVTIREHKFELIQLLAEKPMRTNTQKVDQLAQRVNALQGQFYDQEDVVFAMRWLASGNDAGELEALIIDAEIQISKLNNH